MENEREIRLRRQIEELVRSRVTVLEQDISHLQREVNESFTRLLERTDAAANLPESDTNVEHIVAQVTAEIDQASTSSVRLGADIALLRDSVGELNEQRNQAEVLNTLVARAANFAPRVILFVVKGGNALAWAARGFEDGMGNHSIRGLSISIQADTALRSAAGAAQTCYGSPDQQAENHLLFSRIGTVKPQRVLVVPLKVRGKSAAVFYADSADSGESAINVEAIELLVNTAGLVVELVSLRARVGDTMPSQPSAQPAAPMPAPQPVAAQPPPAPQAVEPGAAPQPEEQPVAEEASKAAPDPDAETVEVDVPPSAFVRPAPESAVPVEMPGNAAPASSFPAFESVAVSPAAEAPGPFSFTMPDEPVAPSAPQPAARTGNEEEEKQHNDARRFARLLVSEIKLYNEQKVSEGRSHKDLYDRLKDDIDRSRQMYDKRVSTWPSVAAKFDYFYDEMVTTLAEGDPSKLGSDYPGPSVV